MPDTDLTQLPNGLMACAEALDNKKAEHLKLLHVGEVSSVTDYFLIVTGTSAPHLRALGNEVKDVLHSMDIDCVVSGGEQSGWTVVDAFDFIVHIFTDEVRGNYNLEGLWKDADPVEMALSVA